MNPDIPFLHHLTAAAISNRSRARKSVVLRKMHSESIIPGIPI
jgi:hypothetical protein